MNEFTKDELRAKLLVVKEQYVNKNVDRLTKIKPIWDRVQAVIPQVEKLEPYINFCTNQELRDLWFYGRLTISSAPWVGDVGRRFQYLIRDKNTGFIIGIVGLSSSLSIPLFDKHIDWSKESKWKQHKINHTMNMSHCISTPELSRYLTGKLCALSCKSKEVIDYFEQSYVDRAVVWMTTSLFGKSSVYNRLDGFEYLGNTKGYSAILVPLEIKEKMRKEYQEKHGKHSEIYTKSDGTVVKYGTVKCYSDDTEILTDNGWKLFKDVTKDTVLATKNLSTDTLEYEKPTNLFSYKYDGDMFMVDAPRINLLVTPNHNLLTQHHHAFYYSNKKFEFVESSDLHPKRKYVMSRSVANWVGKEEEFFVLPELPRLEKMGSSTKLAKKLKMDDWLEFFGWYLSEGCPRPDGYGVLITQKDENAKKEIISCIERLGFRWWNGGDKKTIGINSKQLCAYLKQFGYSYDKFIPKEFKQLSTRQLSILWSSLCAGDGEKRWGTYQSYSSSSRKLAEDVQEISLKLGMATHNQTYETYRLSSYRVGFSHHYKDCKIFPAQRSVVAYSGMVYCVEVPNHTLLVRRNGKTCWCGNSFQKLSKYTNIQRVENFRGVYVIPLAENYREFLCGETDELVPFGHSTFAELTQYWKERWYLPRIQRINDGLV